MNATNAGSAHDVFEAKAELKTSVGLLSYYRLNVVESEGLGSIQRLPFTIRILLECLLRNCDGFTITEDHIRKLLLWQPEQDVREEIPFKPARVVFQDFTGVPALVDLAAMREAMKQLGGHPSRINPLVPCDLVIDHSVQVDFFGRNDALRLNEEKEFQRNCERYQFLKWGQSAFENFRVVPPSTGIIHQVNLEYLSQGVYLDRQAGVVYPDSCVGTDSHTPTVNGLGVLAWGVGGIEAEAVVLDQPIYMLLPEVIGFRLTEELPDGATATDLVLRITEMCREFGVVGKFVEFFGPGVGSLSVPDRATVANMAPEQGSTVSFFPVDGITLEYLRHTGRSSELVDLTERYSKEQSLFRTELTEDPEFSQVIELDLSTVEAALAGPKRPHDRVLLSELGPNYRKTLSGPVGPKGLGLDEGDLEKRGVVRWNGGGEEIGHGAVVIAAITSCTNTSNPSVMVAAGLVAKKAVEKGLRVKRYVKTSLAPGSTVVTEYLSKSGLLPFLEELGFHLVGYGCTTCIGNSGRLPPPVEKAVEEGELVVSAVLSGNRNFEGRVHPLTRTNYLASPPLVVAYAIAGSVAVDITQEPLGTGKEGTPVYLRDIWPTSREVADCVQSFVEPEMFRERYAEVFAGSANWEAIEAAESDLYSWDEDSTYIRKPTFFEDLRGEKGSSASLARLRVLGLFGDSVTTDHISPAGTIAAGSPAARYLESKGVGIEDFNTYGSRRGNHEVMMRGTFANIRIKNQLVPGAEGNVTVHFPTGQKMSFFEAAECYREANTPLMIIAGKEYGSGSSRDWAAKGPHLLGISVVLAESYERIHRSNLIGMGILPVQFLPGESAESLGLDGREVYRFELGDDFQPRARIKAIAQSADGLSKTFQVLSRIDTPVELEYYRDGGILCTVLKKLLNLEDD